MVVQKLLFVARNLCSDQPEAKAVFRSLHIHLLSDTHESGLKACCSSFSAKGLGSVVPQLLETLCTYGAATSDMVKDKGGCCGLGLRHGSVGLIESSCSLVSVWDSCNCALQLLANLVAGDVANAEKVCSASGGPCAKQVRGHMLRKVGGRMVSKVRGTMC